MIRLARKSYTVTEASNCARKELYILSLCKILSILSAIGLLGLPLYAQSGNPPAPYATMKRDEVAYLGPDRAGAKNLPGDVTTIGILLPLQGKQAAQGALLRTAAQMALDDELTSVTGNASPHFALAFRDESERWGQASSEMVQLIDQEHAVALITPTDGNIAHQAEQIANKIGIPVLTLSSDATTTRINIPWIFRLGPSDADQAQLIATDIYQHRNLRRVLLIAAGDHDGRVGSEEFLRAADLLHAVPPERMDYNPATSDLSSLMQRLNATQPDAILLWSGPEAAATLLPVLRQEGPSAAIYLCNKAEPFSTPTQPSHPWFSVSLFSKTTEQLLNFTVRYRRQTGTEPTMAAREMYDAVRLLAAAVRSAGPNRAKVRDYLASGASYSGVSGEILFDKAGNSRGEYVLRGAGDPRIQAAF